MNPPLDSPPAMASSDLITDSGFNPHASSNSIAAEETHLSKRSAEVPFYGDLHHSTLSSSNIDTPRKTGFLDLSAELRNKIYYLALVADGRKIKIGYERCDSRFDADDEEGTGRRPPAVWLIEANGRPLGGLFEFLNIRVLRTCRKVNAEATPIFYGANYFLVPSFNRLRPFCKATIHHVRFLRIQDEIFGPMFFDKVFLKKLEAWTPVMKKLEKLEFAWDMNITRAKDWNQAREIAKRLLPLVKEIQKTKSLDDRATVDMIEVFAGRHCAGKEYDLPHANEQIRAEVLLLLAATDDHDQDKADDSNLRSHASPTIYVTSSPALRITSHAHVPTWEKRLYYFIVWDLIVLVLAPWVVIAHFPTWQKQLICFIWWDLIVSSLIFLVVNAWFLFQGF